jgi:hypothetical protein
MVESANYSHNNSYLGMYNEGWLMVFLRFLEYLDVLECPEFLVNPGHLGCLDLEYLEVLVFPEDPEHLGC